MMTPKGRALCSSFLSLGPEAQFQELLLKDTSMGESKATVLMADESIVWHATLF